MTIESCIRCGRCYGVSLCRRCADIPVRKVIKLFTYEKAQKIVQKFRIKNSSEYNMYYRSGKFPEGMPSNPAKTYSTPDSSKKVSRLM